MIVYRNDRSKAVEILVKDLKVFASFNEDLFKEITQLLTLENFRQVVLYINLSKSRNKEKIIKFEVAFTVLLGRTSSCQNMEIQNLQERLCCSS